MMSDTEIPQPRPRRWLPPLTFQLRLRSLKEITFIGPQPFPREATFILSFHQNHNSEAFWKTEKCLCDDVTKNRLSWPDIGIGGSFGGAKSSFIKISNKRDEGNAIFNAFISLSGLYCLGTLPPLSGCLPINSMVFYMSGSYFVATSSVRKVTKYVSLTPMKNKVLPSYTASLLAKLLHMHRANVQQNLMTEQLEKVLNAKTIEVPKSETKKLKNLSLREQVFKTHEKEASTRIRESQLKAEITSLKFKLDFISKDIIEAKSKRNQDLLKQLEDIRNDIHDRTVVLMHNLHTFSKDIAKFNVWKKKFSENEKFAKHLSHTLKASQMKLLSSFKTLFPIQNPTSRRPTLRWICMPSVTELRTKGNSKREQDFGVTMGHFAHLVSMFSSISNFPLSNPIQFWGSQSSVIDFSLQQSDESTGEEVTFPLYFKNNDFTRVEHAVSLLNEDLAQLRWYYGIDTSSKDLKCSLKNLDDLMNLEKYLAKPPPNPSQTNLTLLHLGPPPISSSSNASNPSLSVVTDESRLSKPNVSSPSETIESVKENLGQNVPQEKNEANSNVTQNVNAELKEVTWMDVAVNRTSSLSITTSFQRHKKPNKVNNL